MDKSMPIGILRGLLVRQKGKCAISGLPLTTTNMTGDHIYPLALQKKEGNPKYLNSENVWLVHKAFNQMKHAFTYDELIENCKMILSNEKETRSLMKDIQNGKIKEMILSNFTELADSVYNEKKDTVDFE